MILTPTSYNILLISHLTIFLLIDLSVVYGTDVCLALWGAFTVVIIIKMNSGTLIAAVAQLSP